MVILVGLFRKGYPEQALVGRNKQSKQHSPDSSTGRLSSTNRIPFPGEPKLDGGCAHWRVRTATEGRAFLRHRNGSSNALLPTVPSRMRHQKNTQPELQDASTLLRETLILGGT